MFHKKINKKVVISLATISLFAPLILNNTNVNASSGNDNITYNLGSNELKREDSHFNNISTDDHSTVFNDNAYTYKTESKYYNDMNQKAKNANDNDIDQLTQDIFQESREKNITTDDGSTDQVDYPNFTPEQNNADKETIKSIVTYNATHQAKMDLFNDNDIDNENTYTTVDSNGDTIGNVLSNLPSIQDVNDANNPINGKNMNQIINMYNSHTNQAFNKKLNEYENNSINDILLSASPSGNYLLQTNNNDSNGKAINNKIHYSIHIMDSNHLKGSTSPYYSNINPSINGTTDLNNLNLNHVLNQRLPDGYKHDDKNVPIITLVRNRNNKNMNQPSYYLNTSIFVTSNNNNSSNGSNNNQKKNQSNSDNSQSGNQNNSSSNNQSSNNNINPSYSSITTTSTGSNSNKSNNGSNYIAPKFNNGNAQMSFPEIPTKKTKKISAKEIKNNKVNVKKNQKHLKTIKKLLKEAKSKSRKAKLNKQLKQVKKVFAKSEKKLNHNKHNVK